MNKALITSYFIVAIAIGLVFYPEGAVASIVSSLGVFIVVFILRRQGSN